MRIDHRFVGISALAIGLVLISLSVVVFFIAVGGPWLGLGEGENFLFFRTWGISRTDSLMRGVQILLLGLASCTINLLYRYNQLRARLNKILSEEPRTLSRSLVKTLVVVAVNKGPKVAWAWEFLNRDWAVVAMLMPFALFILGLYVFAFPNAVWITPDSLGYLGFSINRTLAYPLFVRLVALFTEDPGSIITIQLVFGLGAILFFSEAFQRLFRNFVVSLPVGILLMFNWSMIEHAFYILTDYPFFSMVCLQFGTAILAFMNPNPRRLVALAIVTSMAIWIRPVGMFMVIVVPFLLISHPRGWRAVTGYLVIPLVAFGLAQASVNKAVFNYFGLSVVGGYSMVGNVMFFLEEDTPSSHPEMIRQLYGLVRPYQEEYLAAQTYKNKVAYNFSMNNKLITLSSRYILDYGKKKGEVTYTDIVPLAKFVQTINELSPLNKKFGCLGNRPIPYWVWLDSQLSDLAKKSILHNPSGWFGLVWPNLRYAWNTVIPNYLMPEKGLGPRPTLRLDQKHFGLNLPSPGLEMVDLPVINTKVFNGIAGTLNWLAKVISIPWVVLISSIGIGLLSIRSIYLRRRIPPDIAALMYLVACLFAYHIILAAASIPLPRLISALIPAAMPLLFAPVLLIFSATFRSWLSKFSRDIADINDPKA